jgi:predicted transcriptional regulator
MTKLLEKAIERARALPDEEQDALALTMLTIAEQPALDEPLDDDTRAAIRRGLAEARRGALASEEEVAALWRRYGL